SQPSQMLAQVRLPGRVGPVGLRVPAEGINHGTVLSMAWTRPLGDRAVQPALPDACPRDRPPSSLPELHGRLATMRVVPSRPIDSAMDTTRMIFYRLFTERSS